MNKRYLINRKLFFSKDKGFTLIELLVVISVIAVLTTLLMANFVGIRQRGRDGQRKSNLFSIQTALELYRADNGLYPDTDAFPGCGSSLTGDGGATVYMQTVPCDPIDDADYTYTSADGTAYTLVGCLENENDSEADAQAVYEASGCATPASFTLTNP